MRLQSVKNTGVNKVAKINIVVIATSLVREFFEAVSSNISGKSAMKLIKMMTKLTAKPMKFDNAEKVNPFPKLVQPFLLSQKASANIAPMTSRKNAIITSH